MVQYLKIIRPVNCFITFISVIVAAFIASDNSTPYTVVLFAALSAALVTASGNIINDFYDVEIDKISHPERPMAKGELKSKNALITYTFLNLIALIISLIISPVVFGIVASTIMLLYLYSRLIKRIPILGNFLIAWLTGMVFIFGGIVVNNVEASIIPALFALLINFIREIVKDIQDINGDLSAGIVTLPAKYGIDKAIAVIIILSITLIMLTLHPFIFGYYKIEYFVLVMIVVNPLLVYFLISVYKNRSEENLKKMSSILKLNMVIGLLAIYFGK